VESPTSFRHSIALKAKLVIDALLEAKSNSPSSCRHVKADKNQPFLRTQIVFQVEYGPRDPDPCRTVEQKNTWMDEKPGRLLLRRRGPGLLASIDHFDPYNWNRPTDDMIVL
jgi:hypothetical protein